MVMLALFVFLQITDGLFTFHGVRAVGIDNYEANPLIAYGMRHLGVMNALIAAKIIASFFGYCVYKLTRFYDNKFQWIAWTLPLLTLFYFFNFINQLVTFFDITVKSGPLN